MTLETELRSRLLKPMSDDYPDSKRARDFAARWDRWYGDYTPRAPAYAEGGDEDDASSESGPGLVDAGAGAGAGPEPVPDQEELMRNAELNGFDIDKPVKLDVLYHDGR